jgi:hypothetical protein
VALGLAALMLAAGCGTPSEQAAAEPTFDAGPTLKRQAHDDLVRYDKALAAANGGKVVVTPPSWDPYNAPLGLGIDSATVTADGMRVTVGFTGAQEPATVPCGIDYSAETVEGANAVVVIVTGHPHGQGELCTLPGFSRTASLTLARPLDKRAVLEVVQGLPVPVKRRARRPCRGSRRSRCRSLPAPRAASCVPEDCRP